MEGKPMVKNKSLIDTIDHASLLVNRIRNEFESGTAENALYLTDTLISLYPKNTEAKEKLVQSYLFFSRKIIENGDLDKVESIVSKALQLAPKHSELLSIQTQITHKYNLLYSSMPMLKRM